jgi:hypothetical protein
MPDITRDYAATLTTQAEKDFWAYLPDENPQTVLFSKPILLAGGKIAQIWAESQFYPDFGHTNVSATRWYRAGVSLRTPGQYRAVMVSQRNAANQI